MSIQFTVETHSHTEMVDITTEVQRQTTAAGIRDGIVVVYVPHTTAAITINEGADPAVKADIIETLNALVPWEKVYGHSEGNSPAHIKTSLFGSSVTAILEDGRLHLGQWQAIFLCEFDGPRTRRVQVKVVPTA